MDLPADAAATSMQIMSEEMRVWMLYRLRVDTFLRKLARGQPLNRYQWEVLNGPAPPNPSNRNDEP